MPTTTRPTRPKIQEVRLTAREWHNREQLRQLGPLRSLDWQEIAHTLGLVTTEEAMQLFCEITWNEDLWIREVKHQQGED
jgi:hypothetical protein